MGYRQTDEFYATSDFDFVDPAAQKKFHRETCEVVDDEGSEAELRYKAVTELGELIQERCKTSAKSLRNIYNFVLAGVLKKYGFSPSHEPLLRDMLIIYWRRGSELRDALDKPIGENKRTAAQADWEEACERVERQRPAANDATERDYPEWKEPVYYSFSREAGPG
jgi:hypothetical protein